ncbi:MAG: aa3-type cytochrome c oxidase subunit IV [Asticcacaulis sp.]
MSDPHDSASDDYIKGDMDIKQHEHTFDLFVSMTKWGSLHIATLLVFLVILTCTKMGFLTALIVAAIVGIAGFYLLKGKPQH